jgi:hypothetical protein
MERLSDRDFTTAIFFEEIDLNLELADGLVELLALLRIILLDFLGQFCQGMALAERFKDYLGFEFSAEFPAGSFHDDCWF